MILDKPYGDVSATCRRFYPKSALNGMSIAQLQTIADEGFDIVLRRIYKSRTYLLDHREGILGMNGGAQGPSGHWVVWKEGVILEPWHETHAVFGLEEYVGKKKCRTATLLVKER